MNRAPEKGIAATVSTIIVGWTNSLLASSLLQRKQRIIGRSAFLSHEESDVEGEPEPSSHLKSLT